MDYELAFSVRRHLETKVTELSRVKEIYDGVSLSGVAKPFGTIQSLQTNDTVLAAGRQSYEEVYRYQVGLFASNIGERRRLEEKIRNALRGELALYDENLTLTGDTFICDLAGFTPMSNDDPAKDTYNFHGYFDVAVDIMRVTGAKQFTQ